MIGPKDYVYYEEYNIVSGQRTSNQTIIAVRKGDEPDSDGLVAGITGETGQQHSRAIEQRVSPIYLSDQCSLVTERRAREVHPEIFYRIDNGEH